SYRADLFSAGKVERLARHLEKVVEEIIRDPEQRVGDVDLLGAEERRQVLEEWNETGVEYPKGKCIQEMFEEQVEKSPEAVAVVYEDHSLTYGELNGRANQLAHYLRSLGIGPEVRVGICVERSLEMVVGILGILKAGGAYVPLDPAYPAERRRYMLEDSRSTVLLIQGALNGQFGGISGSVTVLDLADATPR